MAAITLAGGAVLALRFTLPVSGLRTATLEADIEEAVTGTVELEDGANVYQCAIVRSGLVSGVCRADVIGGRGGLLGKLTARSYQGLPARAVLSDVLAAAGETLDATSTPSILATPIPYWTRGAVSGSTALDSLCDKLGARWRVLPNGNVWVGTESWPEADEELQPDQLDRDEAAGTVYLAPDDLTLSPGIVLDGRRVGRVEYSMTRNSPLRCDFWVET
jgi:hypothetical protein